MNAILRRELITLLRTRRAVAIQLGLARFAICLAALATEARVGLRRRSTGARRVWYALARQHHPAGAFLSCNIDRGEKVNGLALY